MAAGGYQRPRRPAPASGPGALSKRTDGGPAQKLRELPDAQYGEAQTFRNLQQAAPLAQTPSPGGAPRPSGGGPATPMTPFGAPTTAPEEPITSGLPFGPGPGPEALGLGQGGMDPQDAARLRAYLPALMEAASRPDSTSQFREYVRRVRAAVA